MVPNLSGVPSAAIGLRFLVRGDASQIDQGESVFRDERPVAVHHSDVADGIDRHHGTPLLRREFGQRGDLIVGFDRTRWQ